MVVRSLFSLLFFVCLLAPSPVNAAVPDPDPDLGLSPPAANASVEELVAEAEQLFATGKPIQARGRLLRAIEVDRNDYRPYVMLCQYYLAQVGEFTLAYRYILTAEKLFLERNGGTDETIGEDAGRIHAAILYLRSESELNLDRYEDSLQTLRRFESRYAADWFPGTKAWVLMKLKRLEEATAAAQSGIIQGYDPRRTYNILGILLSMQDKREQSLAAFARAIAAELSLGSGSQAATPLNNSGEVYREMFKEGLSEAAFIRATKMSDGCEHILPSLNLTHLYIDALRLNAAERALADFESCYAGNGQRLDTEHRTLIALARGRITLRTGDVKKSEENLKTAIERQQWFGKIGTNEDDVRLAAYISLGEMYNAQAEVLADRATANFAEKMENLVDYYTNRFKSQWYFRIARNQAIREMSDFEDLYVRHTDTQLEYPTLGNATAGLPVASFKQRIERLKGQDHREEAGKYYDLYLAENLLANGDSKEALALFENNQRELRKVDALAGAENLAQLILAKRAQLSLLSRVQGDYNSDEELRLQLFKLLPSHLRYYGFKLPVVRGGSFGGDGGCSAVTKLVESNSKKRFEAVSSSPVVMNLLCDNSSNSAKLTLFDNAQGRVLAESSTELSAKPEELVKFYNSFVDKAFTFKSDQPAGALPDLEFLR